MTPHPLDRPIWNALRSGQAKFAVGGAAARRFADDVGPLAGARDESDEAMRELASLLPEDDGLAVFHFGGPLPVVAPAVVARTTPGVQLLLDELRPVDGSARVELLTEADAPAMLALATLTKPGPFRTGTHRLGDFWGIRENGRLLAMAGERLKPPGYAEVSGVCTHPDARGRGYAAQLTHHVATRILARGERPFLHAYADNEPALRIYRALGFRLRASLTLYFLRRG